MTWWLWIVAVGSMWLAVATVVSLGVSRLIAATAGRLDSLTAEASRLAAGADLRHRPR